MDQNVQDMVTGDLIFPEVVIQGETDIADRPGSIRAVKGGRQDLFKVEIGQSDMGILRNIGQIIKNERRIKRI